MYVYFYKPEILGLGCYEELEPKWRTCVGTFKGLPRFDGDGKLVVSDVLGSNQDPMQVTYYDDRKRCWYDLLRNRACVKKTTLFYF